MELTQKQLKKLAEWYGIKVGELHSSLIIINDSHYDEKNSTVDFWQPHIDSNQLDMLEDKMIEECKTYKLSIRIAEDLDGFTVECLYGTGKSFRGRGYTKNEARLNAILKHIEEEKCLE